MFWPVLVPALLFSVGIGATVPVYILAALQLGATDSLASTAVTLMGAASLLLTVPVGSLIDRIGDKQAMTLGTGLAVVVTGLTVVVLAVPLPGRLALVLYVVLLLVRAPVEDIWRLARQAVVAERMPAQDMGKAMTAMGGAQRAGNLIGPLLSAGLLVWFPLWSVFVLSAVCGVLAVVVLNIPALNREFDARKPSQTSVLRSMEGVDAAGLKIRWAPVVLAGIGIMVLTVARVLQPMMVQLWGHDIGLHESGISLLVAVGAAVEMVLMFPGGFIKDWLGRVAVLVMCLTVFGSGFLVMGFFPTVAGLTAAVLVMAVGNGLGAGVNMTIGADFSPAVGRAKFFGIWAIFSNVGQLGGPAMVAALLAVGTLPAAIFASGGLTLAGAVWMLAIGRFTGLPSGTRTADAAEPSEIAAAGTPGDAGASRHTGKERG